jgi:glycosyltransferase involved in cell wall biosynthesis
VTVNSTVALDALAIGVPALVIGLPNNLSPFVSGGAMLGADDEAAIAEAMQRLVADDELRRELLRRGAGILGTSGRQGHAAEDSAGAVLALARTPDRNPLRDVS